MHKTTGTQLFAAIALAALAWCGNLPAFAGERRAEANLDVTIVIPRVLSMKLLDHPRTLRVTEADIARGEVVIRGTRVELVANSRNGYRVHAELRHAAFAGVDLQGLDSPIEVRGQAAVAWMRSAIGAPRPGAAPVEYRFRLAADAQPGEYAWPVALTLEDA